MLQLQITSTSISCVTWRVFPYLCFQLMQGCGYRNYLHETGLYQVCMQLLVSFIILSNCISLTSIILAVKLCLICSAFTNHWNAYIAKFFFFFCYYYCLRKSMVEFEPRLVALACMYLASKAEESIVQARSVIFCIRKLCNFFYLLLCSSHVFWTLFFTLL